MVLKFLLPMQAVNEEPRQSAARVMFSGKVAEKGHLNIMYFMSDTVRIKGSSFCNIIF